MILAPIAILAASSMRPYASILLVVAIAVGLAGIILVLAHTIGPKRANETKESTYESGMPLLADARRRFNVRFYIVAMLFLLFDVEVVILWPWALVFHGAAANGTTIDAAGMTAGKGFLLAGATVFLLLLLVGFVYEWKKGVFRWD
jgi:NADH-quinone oxidoreductase subunit A